MGQRRFITWLIALAVAGALLLAPFATPVMAAHMLPQSTPSQMAMAADDVMAMPEAMECCESDAQQAPAQQPCANCPFVALCMLTTTLPPVGLTHGLIDRVASLRGFTIPDDRLIDGLGGHPPDHPPRTIV